jgi:DNA-binding CsgD family transcriptional regulator
MNVPTTNNAVLDRHGVIIEVNDAWRRFGAANGLCTPDAGLGKNYLNFCTFPGPASAAILGQYQALLAGRRDLVSFLYDCHSDREERWFTVVGFPQSPARFVIAHVDVTDLIRQGRSLRPGTDGTGADAVPAGNGADATLTEKLTPRQRDVLVLLAQGKTNREIAAALSTSPHTVRNQISTILRRLELKNRVAAARLWADQRS